jgi:hypothetical protein
MLARIGATAAAVIGSLFLATPSAATGVDLTYERPVSTSTSIANTVAHFFQQHGFEKSYALVIGVGDYDGFPKLVAPPADALRVRDFLRDQAAFDYIVTLTDDKATPERINKLMEEDFPGRLGPNDRFLFYFSGHGATRTIGDGQRGYLVLKRAGLYQWDQMIDMPRIQEWTENVGRARHTLFLLDACFSGLAVLQAKGADVRDWTIERLMQPGHHIITAGVDKEESYSSGDTSLFTSAFLSAAAGKIDPPPDGVASLDDIMTRIDRALDADRAKFGEKIKMTPHLYQDHIENNAGEFFFLIPSGTSLVTGGPSLTQPRPIASKSAATPTEPDSPVTLAAPAALDRGYYALRAGNYAEALKWYQQAADQGNAMAQQQLGFLYYNGFGVHRDYSTAAIWYRRAAEQGLAVGESSLGWLYQTGLGVPQNYAEARLWNGKAAEQGDRNGEQNLGRLYLNGLGVPKDTRRARKLFGLAAAQGSEEAKELLYSLDP